MQPIMDVKEKEPVILKPIEICHLIDTTLSKLNDTTSLQGIEISKNYSPGHIMNDSRGHIINGNAEKLSLALMKIILNAIEAVTRGKGIISISVYRVHDTIHIILKDNRPVMQPEIATRISDLRLTRKLNGLDEGLTDVKEILDSHHAMVKVINIPGNGTSVDIALRAI